MFNELVEALKAIPNVAFSENEWNPRPAYDHGTVQLDFSAAQDAGDDLHQDMAWQGSVDVYTRGRGDEAAQAVERVLEGICGAAWKLNLRAYERETKLTHREYVFEIEVI